MSGIKKEMIKIVKELYNNNILDTQGGNISAREGDSIFVTKRNSSSDKHWDLAEEDIIETDMLGKARDAKRIADINQIRSAVEIYFDDNGEYPQRATFADLQTDLVPRYLTHFPNDPLNTGVHTYWYAFRGAQRFHLSANLENWSTALNADADLNSTVGGWTGQVVNGTLESCTVDVRDCVYDVGQD